MKLCPGCEIQKSDAAYFKRAGRGLQTYCKPCQKSRVAKVIKKYPKRYAAIFKKSSAKYWLKLKAGEILPPRAQERGTKRCATCGRTLPIAAFLRYLKGMPLRRSACAECTKKDLYAWREENASHIKNYRKKYNRSFREKHPLVYKSSYIYRRFGKAKIKELEALYFKAPWCRYCRVPLTMKAASFDHKTPISRGGSPDALANLQVTCLPCNYLKAERTHREFLAFLRKYILRFKDRAERALGTALTSNSRTGLAKTA